MVSTAWMFLKNIPPWIWLCVVILVGGWYYGHTRYDAGQADVQAHWDASVAKGKAEVDRLKAEAGKVTVRVETKYIDRVKTVKEKGDVIVKQVPIYISRDIPELPGAWRMLHDAAAKNVVPNAANESNAATVAPVDAAATVAENYATCHINAERLISLQEWVSEQRKINP